EYLRRFLAASPAEESDQRPVSPAGSPEAVPARRWPRAGRRLCVVTFPTSRSVATPYTEQNRKKHSWWEGARIVVRVVAVPNSSTWVPETRYARNGEVHIAYQDFGEGDLTFVGLPGIVSNIEVAWEDPEARRWLTGLASFARVVHFDKQ